MTFSSNKYIIFICFQNTNSLLISSFLSKFFFLHSLFKNCKQQRMDPLISKTEKASIIYSRKCWVISGSIVLTLVVFFIVLFAVIIGNDSVTSCDMDGYQSGLPTKNATQSFWLKNAPFQDINSDTVPSSVNITIIGAGMSGTSVLYHLAKYLNNDTFNPTNDRYSVLLIDCRGASGGATGRNGGIMRTGGSARFNYLLNKYGNQTAMDEYNFRYNTMMDVIQFINDNNIDAPIQQRGYVTRVGIDNDLNELGTIINNTRPYNMRSLNESLLDSDGMRLIGKSDYYTSGMYQYNATFLTWPAKIVFGLLNYSIMNSGTIDLNIQFNTCVTGVNNMDNHYVINTENDHVIDSDIVVYATNAYTSYLLPDYVDKIIPMKNQVILTDVIDYRVWETDVGISDSYQYYGQRMDDNKIIIGGGRNEPSIINNENQWIGNYNDSDIINTNVNEYLLKILGYHNITTNIDMVWQGILTRIGGDFPYIGPLNDKNTSYIAAGYDGSGMSIAFNAGNAIASMIVGNKNYPFLPNFLPKNH